MAITELFKSLTEFLRQSREKDDRAFAEHLIFVANRVLQTIRREQWSKKAKERIGKLLLRLFFVYQAYRTRKGETSLLGWLKRLSSVCKEG